MCKPLHKYGWFIAFSSNWILNDTSALYYVDKNVLLGIYYKEGFITIRL